MMADRKSQPLPYSNSIPKASAMPTQAGNIRSRGLIIDNEMNFPTLKFNIISIKG
jgi:hypothetical protein